MAGSSAASRSASALIARAGRLVLGAVAIMLVIGAVGPPLARGQGSLPHVLSGARPGPDILYAPRAEAPQLTNTGIWRAAPILVSGASAYRDGEFLYQDFIYDDHGARGFDRDPSDPRTAFDGFSLPGGTYTYPTDPRYAGNAADLVELRVKPLPNATAFRITLNTMHDPSLVATTIALGDSPTARPLPHGANASAPAELFLTVHGASADLVDAASGAPVPVTPAVSVDEPRRQIEVRLPHSVWNPGQETVRLAAGVGLWDPSAQSYLLPQVSADATRPGGGLLPSPPAFFNAAFRHGEDIQLPDFSILFDPGWWRDRDQGHALANGDLGAFSAKVDFAKLASGVSDDMPDQPGGVPQTGPMDRILASHFETAQGVDYAGQCTKASGFSPSCPGILRGRLQPYAVYVPKKPLPPRGFGLTLLLHSFAGSYNQYLGSRHQSQFGERGQGSIVVTPAGRGPDGWYHGYSGADAFEVWADTARHHRLDPSRSAIAGYSMGGYGTWKLAGQFPDLFARAQPTVGPTRIGPFPGTDTVGLVSSLRHIPFLIWLGAGDESVPPAGAIPNTQRLDALGYRYEQNVFRPFGLPFVPDHFILAFNDQYAPAAEFLGDATVARNPARVTYAYDPAFDFPQAGLSAGHAYWVSKVRPRSTATGAPVATIDVRSHGFGAGDPPVGALEQGTSSLPSVILPPGLPFDFQRRDWGTPTPARALDRLDIEVTNVASVTIDPWRARVSCRTTVNITSDGPLDVELTGCRGNGWHRGHFKKLDRAAQQER